MLSKALGIRLLIKKFLSKQQTVKALIRLAIQSDLGLPCLFRQFDREPFLAD